MPSLPNRTSLWEHTLSIASIRHRVSLNRRIITKAMKNFRVLAHNGAIPPQNFTHRTAHYYKTCNITLIVAS